MLNIPSTKSKRISGTGRKAWWSLVAGWLAVLPLLSLSLATARTQHGFW